MTVYINIRIDGEVETIDEFETKKEAIEMLKQYRIASNYYNRCYLSRKSTKEWKERK